MTHLDFWNWGVFDRFTWTHAATLLAASIASAAVLAGFFVTSAHARRQRRAHIYADAIGAVASYREGPYRVARCHNSDEQRYALTTAMSETQARLDAVGLLLHLHAPTEVADAFDRYVAAARDEAGAQMESGWRQRPAKRHADMNLSVPFGQPRSVAAKEDLVNAMERDMAPRWYLPWTGLRG